MKKMNIKLGIVILIGFVISSCNRNEVKYDTSGTFETTEIIVSAQAAGEILSFNIKEGDSITAGNVLGVIDSVQLYLSKIQLMTNKKAVSSQKTNVNKQLAVLEEQLTTAKREKQRFENLLEADAINRKQLDDINAQISLLEKQIDAQRSTMIRGNITVNEESSSIEIQIAQLNDQLKKCYITSPISGIVLVKYAEMGEMAAPGKALFKVANLDEMILRAYVTAGQFTQLKLGQDVDVFADFGEDDNTRKYSGNVIWISEKAEFTPKTVQTRDERDNLVYAVKIRVKNDGFLKIGMYGNVNFD